MSCMYTVQPTTSSQSKKSLGGYVAENPVLAIHSLVAIALLIKSSIEYSHRPEETELTLTNDELEASNLLDNSNLALVIAFFEAVSSEISRNSSMMDRITNATVSNYNNSLGIVTNSTLIEASLNQTITLLTKIPELQGIIQRCIQTIADNRVSIATSSFGITGSGALAASSLIEYTKEAGNEIYRLGGTAYNAKDVLGFNSLVQVGILAATAVAGFYSKSWQAVAVCSACGYTANVLVELLGARREKLSETAPKLNDIESYKLTTDLKKYSASLLKHKKDRSDQSLVELSGNEITRSDQRPSSQNPSTTKDFTLKLQADFSTSYNKKISDDLDAHLKDIAEAHKLLDLCEVLTPLVKRSDIEIEQIKVNLSWLKNGEEGIKTEITEHLSKELAKYRGALESKVLSITTEISSYGEAELTQLTEDIGKTVKDICLATLTIIHKQSANLAGNSKNIDLVTTKLLTEITELNPKSPHKVTPSQVLDQIKNLTNLKALQDNKNPDLDQKLEQGISILQSKLKSCDDIYETRSHLLENLNKTLKDPISNLDSLESGLNSSGPSKSSFATRSSELRIILEQRDSSLVDAEAYIRKDFTKKKSKIEDCKKLLSNISTQENDPKITDIISKSVNLPSNQITI